MPVITISYTSDDVDAAADFESSIIDALNTSPEPINLVTATVVDEDGTVADLLAEDGDPTQAAPEEATTETQSFSPSKQDTTTGGPTEDAVEALPTGKEF